MEPILLKNVKIPEKPDGPGEDGNGVFAFVYRGKEVREIEKKYGRKNCCLKIFKAPFKEELEDAWWAGGYKGSPLKEAVAIQNIYSMEGLAPRVYAVFPVITNGETLVMANAEKHWAYLVEDLGHYQEKDDDDVQQKTIEKLVEVGQVYGIIPFNDGRKWNVISGKYVDFQGFRFAPDYKEKLKSRLVGVANVGKWGPFMNYHSIPELGIIGGRDNELRIKKLHLDEIDFKGKTVLDIGCSEGFFTRYAIDQGAKKATGVDLPGVVRPVQELTYFLGYNNIDFYGADLKSTTFEDFEFDITLFLSMVHHVGLPDWMITITKELFVFEGNGKKEDEAAIEKLHGKRMGGTSDLLERPVVWLKK